MSWAKLAGSLLACVLVSSLLQSAAVAPRPAHRALIVGVSDYSHASDDKNDIIWPNLTAEPDCLHLQAALVASGQFDAAKDEIKLLGPSVSRSEFVKTLRELVANSEANDILYLHFSGHGCAAWNPKSGESGSEDQDNGLVFSDSHGLDPKRLLMSQDLAGILTSGKCRHVFVSIDACNSGGITRGGNGIYRSRGGAFAKIRMGQIQSRAFVASAPNVVVFSAARFNQSALEGSDGGVFSLALAHSLADSRGQTMTYRDLFEEMNGEMHSDAGIENQDPVASGSLDQTVFEGQPVPPARYFPVHTEKSPSGLQVVLEAGQVHGITLGTAVELYRGSIAGSPIASAQVTMVGVSQSILAMNPGFQRSDPSNLRGLRAVVTQVGVGDGAFRLSIDPTCKGVPSDWIQELLHEGPLRPIQTGIYDFKLQLKGENIAVEGADGSITSSEPNSVEGRNRLLEQVLQLCRWKSLLQLQNSVGCPLRAELRVRHVTTTELGDQRFAFKSAVPFAANDGQFFPPDGFFALQVRSTAPAQAAFSASIAILDLHANHLVQQLWPDDFSQQQKFFLKPDGKWRWLSIRGDYIDDPAGSSEVAVWRFNPGPSGQEPDGVGTQIFKIMATKEPVDYRGLLDPARGVGDSVRGGQTALGNLIRRYTEGVRGPATTGAIAAKEWTTGSCIAVNSSK